MSKRFIRLTSVQQKVGILPRRGKPIAILPESVIAVEPGKTGADPKTGEGGADCTVLHWAHGGAAGMMAVEESAADVERMIDEALRAKTNA